MFIALLTLLACGSTTPPDCETLDEASCKATDGCFPITARLIDCENGGSEQAYAGCMSPRKGNGDSGLACEDMSYYCQTVDTPGSVWFFNSLCVPESIECTFSPDGRSDFNACELVLEHEAKSTAR